MIQLPERVSYDSLTGEVVEQDVLAMRETQTGTDMVLVCDSCGTTWNCHSYQWPMDYRQKCHKCGAKKSVHEME